MKTVSETKFPRHVLGIAILALLMCPITLLAQEPQSQPQQQTAPPPLRVIPPDERSILADLKDTKTRVKKTLELAEGHLLKAEGLTAKDEFTEASAELGRYWALIEDLFRFLDPLDSDKTKTRDLYKRVELTLRAHGPRLTMMRRGTPIEYAVWIKAIEEFTRSSRTEALNSFYGHTVVREGQLKLDPDKPSPKQGLAPPESKQP